MSFLLPKCISLLIVFLSLFPSFLFTPVKKASLHSVPLSRSLFLQPHSSSLYCSSLLFCSSTHGSGITIAASLLTSHSLPEVCIDGAWLLGIISVKQDVIGNQISAQLINADATSTVVTSHGFVFRWVLSYKMLGYRRSRSFVCFTFGTVSLHLRRYDKLEGT